MDVLHQKEEKLKEIIRSYGRVAVAFSSGVDSTYLLHVAHEVLGDKAVALTAQAAFFPARETDETVDFCGSRGIRQILIPVDVMEVEGLEENTVDRCYICKKNLFSEILKRADNEGLGEVVEGSNVDDENDYRPGSRAIAELQVKSPLKEAGLTKADIRTLSEERGLDTWNKPAFACLASRIPYNERISPEKLAMVERAEDILSDNGFTQYRVRVHEAPSADGYMARIEILPEEFGRIMDDELRNMIVTTMKEIGFDFVTLDLGGYRMGNMNRGIEV